MRVLAVLLIGGALVALFFFRRAVKSGAYSSDRTYGGAIRSIFRASLR